MDVTTELVTSARPHPADDGLIVALLGLSDCFVGRGDADSARRAADGARCLGRSAARLYIASVARGAAAAS
jgi:hypothetical protein